MAGIVDLGHLLFRGDQPVEQLAVVGKQQQPLGGLVQASHGLQLQMAQLRREQLHHRFFPGVPGGGHVALRLVHHEHRPVLSGQADPIQGDLIFGRVNFAAAVLFRRAVHLHSAGSQDQLYLAAGARAAVTQEFVQSFHFLLRSIPPCRDIR